MLALLKILSIFRIIHARWVVTLNKAPNEIFQRDVGNKNSTKVFYILGCGSSINHLSDREIKIINRSVSVGINLLIMHEQVKPTFYSVELSDSGSDGKVKNSQMCCELIKKKALKDKDLKFIINVDNWPTVKRMMPDILNYGQINLVQQVTIPGRTKIYFQKLHRFLISKYVIKLLRPEMIYGKNASVVALVYLAILRGYKDIVLFGVDLTSEYFWEIEDNIKKYPGSEKFINMHKSLNLKHQTDMTPLPVSEVLTSINDSNCGITIWVGSSVSQLADHLPVFSFDE